MNPHSDICIAPQETQECSTLQPKQGLAQLCPNRDRNDITLFGVIGGYSNEIFGKLLLHNDLEVGGIVEHAERSEVNPRRLS